jgi:ABC-type lipoprotein export system ATPase subunit
MLLEIEDLTKTYQTGQGAVRAVDQMTLYVDNGQFVAVQGPSGCGKTTLLLVAGGLLAPDSGTVRIAGEYPYDLPPDRRAKFRARRVGFVFQQFHLVPYLSVLDNVLAPSLAADPKAADLRERAAALIAKFGLANRQHHVPGQLSTGERQRTALARALLNDPAVLLADEPTGNLDQENADIVLGHLAAFAEQGGAVLMVTHDNDAAARAHRIESIREGKLLASPTNGERGA